MGKVMTMKEAISKYVKSGQTVFLSGMQHGEPSAAIHEIIRQKIDHLKLVCALVTTLPLLIGEGMVDKAYLGFGVADVKRSPSAIKAKTMGKLPKYEEYSHFGISLALLAGQMGIPYIPTRCQIGSDMLKYNPNVKITEDPFSGKKIGAVKAIVPDIGILHVQRCDAEGNAQKWGSLGIDVEGTNASQAVIVTTEKIVDSDVIRRDPNRTIIPGFRVVAVVEQPWGAYPMHLAGCYTNEPGKFIGEMGNPESYDAYVKRLIYGLNSWEEYLKEREAMKWPGYFESLRIKGLASEPIYTAYEGVER